MMKIRNLGRNETSSRSQKALLSEELDIAIIFRHSNVTATDCRIQPNAGALIMLGIEPSVNWGNAC